MNRTKVFLKVFFTALFLGAVIGCCFVACNFVSTATFETDFDINSFELSYTTTIVSMDKNGTEHVIDKIYDKNRQWVDYENIPQALKDAIVCIEDERFYYHNGVDFIGTAKAVGNYVVGKKNAPGGSTITQQLVKNLTDNRDVKWQRKVTEILRALNVESTTSKEDILEMYLNTVYFGNGCYGVKSAAKVYFGKNPQDLTLLECASIAGLTQNPEGYNPFNEKCKDAFTERRNSVLTKMHEFKKISDEEYNTLLKTQTDFSSKGASETSSTSTSYFVQKLIEDVKVDLCDKYDMTYSEATDYLKKGGLKIYATIDTDVQDAIDSVYKAKKVSESDPQSAIVVLDPYSGDIKGMAGGFGETTQIKRNRTYDDPRQPGSAIKPISVYAPAIEKDIITPSSIVEDTAYTAPDGTVIKNYDKTYSGNITVRYALQKSKNPPVMRILDELGIDNSFNYLKNKFCISTLDERDKAHSPLALGGLTHGVRVDELTAAYAPFVNGGIYYKPHTYSHVTDSHGKIVLDNRDQGTRAIDESTSYVMNSLLQSVVNSPGGTAYGTRAKISGVPTGGKTGTTDDDADRWFVGITPKYVAAVWYGYDDRREVKSSGNPCIPIWSSVMEKAYSSVPASEKSKAFFDGKIPSDVTAVSVCSSSGKLAGSGCSAVKEYYKKGTAPTSYCTSHRVQEPEDTSNENSDNTDDSQITGENDGTENENSSPAQTTSPQTGSESTSDKQQ